MPKTKLTGFSRLLLFLLIALPVIYFAASYYNGEDPVANVKGWLGMNEPRTEEVERSESTPERARDAPATFENVQELRAENDRLREELARCRAQSGS
jgi:hypothetical protein